MRGPLAPAAMPITKSRAVRFDDLVLSEFERLQHAHPELADVTVVVAEVPMVARRDGSPDPVPLGRLTPARGEAAACVTIFRRPIELRSSAGLERRDLLADVLTEMAAELLGLPPARVDADYDMVSAHRPNHARHG